MEAPSILDHPAMIRLKEQTDNIHWIYHVAHQLQIVEDFDIENDGRCELRWDQNYIDTLMYWKHTPQGTDFWMQVSEHEHGYGKLESLPWFIDGKLQWRDRDFRGV